MIHAFVSVHKQPIEVHGKPAGAKPGGARMQISLLLSGHQGYRRRRRRWPRADIVISIGQKWIASAAC